MAKRIPVEHSALKGSRHGTTGAEPAHDGSARSGRSSSLSLQKPPPSACGVGGGMRIQDSVEQSSRIGVTACDGPNPLRPISLNGQRIMRGLFCCSVVAFLALGHVHLRFAINDTRVQHQLMQVGHRELLQEHMRLQ
jgi:hypothetical protein